MEKEKASQLAGEIANELDKLLVARGFRMTSQIVKEMDYIIHAALLQVVEEKDRLRFKLFHFSKHEGTSHTTACSIWREDGQGHAEGLQGSRGPCNCGALENYERERAEKAEALNVELVNTHNTLVNINAKLEDRAETAEATIATLTRELNTFGRCLPECGSLVWCSEHQQMEKAAHRATADSRPYLIHQKGEDSEIDKNAATNI